MFGAVRGISFFASSDFSSRFLEQLADPMALVLFHTKNVRKALESPASLGVDVLLLLGITGLIAAVAMMFGQASAPLHQTVYINLSLLALPKYTLLSLGRGFAAYVISLIFTLIYGTIAAHNHKAEKVMIPALDIMQSIPVLAFLPGLVLAMINLFPRREIGLELSCILMIFTAQVWNMTFSFHGSLRSIPTALREVSALQRLTGWQIFKLLEVPAAMTGLVWNSMMSMAGGWFFLTVNEAFQLTINGVNHDFRLPGIGSYMQEAIDKNDHVAQFGAIVAMTIMIIIVDQVFWRPIVVWSQRFRLEDSAGTETAHSWVVDLFKRSKLLVLIPHFRSRLRSRASDARALAARMRSAAADSSSVTLDMAVIKRWISWIVLALLAVIACWGGAKLLNLFVHLPIRDFTPHDSWTQREDWLTVLLALLASFARTTSAVLLGAAWTLPVGILIGLSPKWSHRLQPVTQVLASFPAPMLFPLVFAALAILHIPFGIGCVALMLLGAQWYILFNVVAGASAIPAELKEAASVYGMGTFERWRRLYLPSVFPSLVTGLVTAAGGAWNSTIVAEALQLHGGTIFTFGLGSIISQASAGGKYPLLAASVIVMSLAVVALNRIIWKRLYRLAESRYSLNV
jgi:NitT/TauT family transport system permease protein